MKCVPWACLIVAGVLLAGGAAHAGIIQDFQFGDANGTVITSAANSAAPGNNFLSQNTAINAGVLNGAFRIQKGGETPPVPGQVSNTFDMATVSTGKVWLVADISGWLYTETPSATSERVRFAFLDNDIPAAGSSTITAGINLDRGANNTLTLNAEAGGGSPATMGGTAALALTRSTPITLVVEVDADADSYSSYYKDGAAPYVSIGTGTLGDRSAGIKREARSVRFAFTGSFSDTGEFVDVDRIYVTDVNPVPEPATFVLAAITVAMSACWRRARS